MYTSNYVSLDKLLELKKATMNLSLQHWYDYELFTWQWWIKFLYLVIPIFAFYKLLDRKRIFEVLTYGLMISIISIILDLTGVNFILWDYPIRFVPIGIFLVHDLVFIPIVSMLIFQKFSTWKSFATANIILSAVGAYIEEPIAIWINIYKPLNWKHTYSFIVFFTITILCKCCIQTIREKISHATN